jgi:hypothetical protein
MPNQSHFITLLMLEAKSSNHVPRHLALSTLFYKSSTKGKFVIGELEKCLEGSGRGLIDVLSRPLSGQKSNKIYHSEQTVYERRFERDTTRISANSITTLGEKRLYSLCVKTTQECRDSGGKLHVNLPLVKDRS